MMPLRVLVGALGLALLGAIVWAWGEGHFLREAEVLWAMPWGRVTLTDLYVTFTLVAIVIFLTERSWWRSIFWIAPLPFIGGLWAAAWFVVRLPVLAERLGGLTKKPEA